MNRRRYTGRPKKRGIGIGGVILTIFIGILSLTLVSQCIYIISELTEKEPSYFADEDNYIRNTTYEDYYRLMEDTFDDSLLNSRHTETEEEIRALAYYYEAALLYKAYVTVNDVASAAKQQDRMTRYKSEAGSYTSETKKIDELLDLGA